MKELLSDAIDTAVKMPQIDYESILDILSLVILLNDSEKSLKLIEKFDDMIKRDKLLSFFSSYILNGKGEWSGEFVIPNVYDDLNDLEKGDNSKSVMIRYFNSWYSKHDSTSWYESDKNPNDIYVGYWCFEGAALCRVLGVDERELTSNIYYPLI